MELINIYKLLASVKAIPEYDIFIKSLSQIKEQLLTNIDHEFLLNIKKNIETEVSVLLNLLKTQVHLGNYDFKESLFLLYAAKTELDNWRLSLNEYSPKENEGFKPFKSGVYHWLNVFQRSLHSKLTFYFYPILEKSGDMTLCNQLDINYYSVVENFVTKSQCHSVCLVLDSSKLTNTRLPTGVPEVGYQLPSEEEPAVQGIASWPCVFSYPREAPPLNHWHNIVSLIIDNIDELDKYQNPVYFHDDKLNFTYYISKVEPRLLIVILFLKKRKKNDQVIDEFLWIMSTHLRNIKVFSRLKPQGS